MRAITFAVVVVGAAAMAGCQDPEVAITLDFSDATLAGEIAQLQVSVYELDGKTCDELAYGHLSAEVQDESLRSRVVLPRGGRVELSGIPRLGDKLIGVIGLEGNRQVLAGGCAELGEIDDDLVVPITMHRSVILRVLPSELLTPSLRVPTDVGAELSLFARYRRLDGVALPDEALTIWLRAKPTEVEVPYGTIELQDAANDLYSIRDLSGAVGEVGPVELVIRGRWADQVGRISASVSPPTIEGLQLDLDGPNQVEASWAVLEDSGSNPNSGEDDRLVAVARYRGDSGGLQLVVAREGADDQLQLQPAVPAPGVRALTVFRDGTGAKVVGRTATGWVTVDWRADPPIMTSAPPDLATASAAEQLLGLPRCGGVAPGVVGVVGAEVIVWGNVDGSPPLASGRLRELAIEIGKLTTGGATLELLGVACLMVRGNASLPEDPPVEQPVVAVRATSLGRAVIYLVTPERPAISTPFVGGISVFKRSSATNDFPSILAVTIGASGPRVGTYRLRYDVSPAEPAALIPDLMIDHPLSTAAISVVAVNSDLDGAFNSLALHALPGALGLSMTRGSNPPGNELSAMTVVPILGTDQRVLRVGLDENDDGMPGRDEVMVAGDQGLAIYRVVTQ